MADKIEEIVENIENMGNNFIDKIAIPLFKSTISNIADESIIGYFLKFKTEYIKQKISLYVEYIKDQSEEDIINFIENLNDEDRKFLINSINKSFELNDDLQIYLLAYLTKEYQKKGSLNYFEQSIYYNIGQMSEDDLKVFSNTILKLKPSENNNQAFPLIENNLNKIEKIVLGKFANIGIITIEHGGFGGSFILKTEYCDKLVDIIQSFYKYTN